MIDADLFVGCLLLLIDAVRPLGRRVGGVGVLFCVFVGLLSRIFLFLSSLFWRVRGRSYRITHSVSLSQSLITLGITSTSQHHYYHYHRELERAQPPPGV